MAEMRSPIMSGNWTGVSSQATILRGEIAMSERGDVITAADDVQGDSVVYTESDAPGTRRFVFTFSAKVVGQLPLRTDTVTATLFCGYGIGKYAGKARLVDRRMRGRLQSHQGVMMTGYGVFIGAVTGTLYATAMTGDGAAVTVTAPGHGLAVSDAVTIAGATVGTFNGAKTVASVPDQDTFTYAAAVSGAAVKDTGYDFFEAAISL